MIGQNCCDTHYPINYSKNTVSDLKPWKAGPIRKKNRSFRPVVYMTPAFSTNLFACACAYKTENFDYIHIYSQAKPVKNTPLEIKFSFVENKSDCLSTVL